MGMVTRHIDIGTDTRLAGVSPIGRAVWYRGLTAEVGTGQAPGGTFPAAARIPRTLATAPPKTRARRLPGRDARGAVTAHRQSVPQSSCAHPASVSPTARADHPARAVTRDGRESPRLYHTLAACPKAVGATPTHPPTGEAPIPLHTSDCQVARETRGGLQRKAGGASGVAVASPAGGAEHARPASSRGDKVNDPVVTGRRLRCN